MFIGSLTLDLLLGDIGSLKGKRAVIRPILADLRRSQAVSAAETGCLDLHRRAELGVAVASPDAAHARAVLEACERAVADRPEVVVLSARLRLWNDADE